ncbi:sulfotransferase family 2 domain-containing protein [Candidatus Mycobacterium methanotrophicum]|uniref:Sulfotransferase family 2 domain-containing protein n=1 Tax=Candidatus Mycobacterium methanotrophicum TaxID=2943498 RepID=A0ABY4QHS3_9MYCO|nr:sulfotransferase family 2 domain-containing protein [Candidatus Mycobacterium methanotrophicum]UQX10572.1 sulfotransferase family 2 domain-containing protein [Candidatus Mycobacterium methanotrophicum]
MANFHDNGSPEFYIQLQKPEKFEWSEQIISIPLFREGRYKALPENFDAKFYLDHHPDVVQARVDPAEHYLEYGRFEGRAVCEATGWAVPDRRCLHQPRKQGVTLVRSDLPQQRPITWRYLGSKTVIRPASPYVFMLDEPLECAIVRPDASVKIRGWAYLEGTPLTLHVVVGEHEVAVASCEIYRPGVVRHFGDKTEGHVGFDVELPVTVRLGQKVELRFTDSSGMVRAVHSLSFGSSDAFQRMFLVHVPKTAGSSVNAFMEDCLGERACASHIESNPEWKFGAGPDTIFEDKVFLSGHVHLRALRHKLTLQNTLVTTMLRDPIDQLISHIAWVRRLADPDEKKRFYQHDAAVQHIATCLAKVDLGSPVHLKKWASELSGEAQSLFDNCQVRYLTDRGQTDRGPTGRVTQRDLQGAIRNLEIFDLVGRSDRVPSFLTKVAEKMRLERSSASDVNVRENVAKTKYGLDSRDPSIREALESLLQFDQVLYDKVAASESVAESV